MNNDDLQFVIDCLPTEWMLPLPDRLEEGDI